MLCLDFLPRSYYYVLVGFLDSRVGWLCKEHLNMDIAAETEKPDAVLCDAMLERQEKKTKRKDPVSFRSETVREETLRQSEEALGPWFCLCVVVRSRWHAGDCCAE